MKDTRELADAIGAAAMADGRRLIMADRRDVMLESLLAIKEQAKRWAASKPNRHWFEILPQIVDQSIHELEDQIRRQGRKR